MIGRSVVPSQDTMQFMMYHAQRQDISSWIHLRWKTNWPRPSSTTSILRTMRCLQLWRIPSTTAHAHVISTFNGISSKPLTSILWHTFPSYFKPRSGMNGPIKCFWLRKTSEYPYSDIANFIKKLNFAAPNKTTFEKTDWCHSSVGRAKDWKSLCPWFDSRWHHYKIISVLIRLSSPKTVP